jgi:hypothetical protein
VLAAGDVAADVLVGPCDRLPDAAHAWMKNTIGNTVRPSFTPDLSLVQTATSVGRRG